MPLFRDGLGSAPAWCELTLFEIIRLSAGARHAFAPSGRKERLIVASGACRLALGGEEVDATEGAKYELPAPGAHAAIVETREPTTVVRLCGSWGDETGGWGLFRVEEVADPVERGDPTDYPKRTRIDNHYHDCDEYYIILYLCTFPLWSTRGRSVATFRGRRASHPTRCRGALMATCS